MKNLSYFLSILLFSCTNSSEQTRLNMELKDQQRSDSLQQNKPAKIPSEVSQTQTQTQSVMQQATVNTEAVAQPQKTAPEIKVKENPTPEKAGTPRKRTRDEAIRDSVFMERLKNTRKIK